MADFESDVFLFRPFAAVRNERMMSRVLVVIRSTLVVRPPSEEVGNGALRVAVFRLEDGFGPAESRLSPPVPADAQNPELPIADGATLDVPDATQYGNVKDDLQKAIRIWPPKTAASFSLGRPRGSNTYWKSGVMPSQGVAHNV
jgi:hypothetical protein